MHDPKKLLKIQAAKYAKLKYLASTSTYPYSYCRSRQHEQKQTAKILWGGGGEKQQLRPNLLEAANKTPCENFIIITTLFSDQASKGIWSFQQNTMPSTIMDQAFYLKTYFLFLNPQW